MKLQDVIDGLPNKPRATPERSVQVTLVSWLQQVMPGVIVAAVKNEHAPKSLGEKQRARFFHKRKKEGVKPGYPDLVVDPLDQPSFRIETKAPKNGVVSATQADVHADLEARGTVVIVADSIESLRLGMQRRGIRTIEAAGQPVRELKIRYAKPKAKIAADTVPF